MSREVINVVSDDSDGLLSREEPRNTSFEWVYSTEPEKADWHVVRGVTRALAIPNPKNRVFFALGEPPEVRKYDRRALGEYGSVLSPRFAYLRTLHNLSFAEGLLPWRAGIRFHEFEPPTVSMTRQELEVAPEPTSSAIAAIVSQKADTPIQVARLRLLEALQRVVPEIEIWGRGSREVADTAEVFSSHGVSIAMENSLHQGYWTEKLADPLLFLNRVAYLGHAKSIERFSSRQVLLLNPFRIRDSQQQFLKWLDLTPNAKDREAALAARSFILESGSFHRVIEKHIGLMSSSTSPSPPHAETNIPDHRDFGGSISLPQQIAKFMIRKSRDKVPALR